MAVEWWLIIGTPAGPRCWPLGDPDDATRDRLVAAGRILAGFPATEEWVDDGSPWDVQLAPGEPHPTLTARAVVGELAELQAVPPARVAAYNKARITWGQALRASAVASVLSGLDDEQLAAVLADPAVAAKVRGVP